MLIGAFLLAIMGGEASAARKPVSSGASLDSVSADGLVGHVSTRQAACRAKRTVTVYMVNSASPTTTVPVATAITQGDGSWSVRNWAYPGEYFAAVADRTTRHFLCRTATSNSVTWWTSGAAS